MAHGQDHRGYQAPPPVGWARSARLCGLDRRVRPPDARAVGLFRPRPDLERNRRSYRPWSDQFHNRSGSVHRRRTPAIGRNIELANEIHGTSIEALQAETRGFQAQLTGAVHHPLSTIVPVLVPLIAIIVKNMRKTAVESATDASSEARS